MQIVPRNAAEESVCALDLEAVMVKLMDRKEGSGWSLQNTESAIALYRGFLIINLRYPDDVHVPTKTIDAVWHRHILDSRKYLRDCDAIFGAYFHHFPYFGMRGEEDAQARAASFAKTKERFAQEFGVSLDEVSATKEGAACKGCGASCRGIDKDSVRPSLQQFLATRRAA